MKDMVVATHSEKHQTRYDATTKDDQAVYTSVNDYWSLK